MLRGNKQRESRDDTQLLDKGQNINEVVVIWCWNERPSSQNMPSRILGTSGRSGLGSADAQPWWLAVAAAKVQSEQLDHSTVKLVKIESGEAVKLHQGTWHAGPFFVAPTALFFNLELSDTNLIDHNSQPLKKKLKLNLSSK